MSLTPQERLANFLAAGPVTEVTITFENLSDAGGWYFSPTFLGLHNGEWDLFDLGTDASVVTERLAQDGAADMVLQAFQSQFGAEAAGGVAQATGAANAINPGETVRLRSRSMILPSSVI